ncbi:hypothetical protein TI01_1781 [Lysobacter sp. A03]|nr:hypothetical protein TI01_1781 [Lysobacter sp. A03]
MRRTRRGTGDEGREENLGGSWTHWGSFPHPDATRKRSSSSPALLTREN